MLTQYSFCTWCTAAAILSGYAVIERDATSTGTALLPLR
jgi:hypothetical protein